MNIAKVFVLLLFLILCLTLPARANMDSTGVKTINGQIYILHKVEAGQGLYAVARRYRTTVPLIEKANPKMGKTLSQGQIVLVPYSKKPIPGAPKPLSTEAVHPKKVKTTSPKTKTATAIAPDTEVSEKGKEPIYHTVTKKETLHQIAVNHKLTEEQVRQWNGGDDMKPVKAGQKIIVGYKAKKTTAAKTETTKTVAKKQDPKKTSKTASAKKGKKKDSKTAVAYEPKVPGDAKKRIVNESGMGTWVDDGSIKTDVSLAMHKSAPEGTIIKITNPMNNKVKYVKVVGTLPDIDENKNILIKISKNTADELGIMDKDFRVNLEYAVADTSEN